MAPVSGHIVRNDGKECRHSFPDSCCLRRRVESLVIDSFGFQKRRSVNDVAKPDVKMAIHALQGADHQSVLCRRDPKDILFDFDLARARDQGTGELNLLTGLTKASDVDFHQFRQVWNDEIPLVGEAVAPTAFRKLSLETLLHDLNDICRIAIRVEIEIAAEIGPVIKRLDNDWITPSLLQLDTDRSEE